MSRAARTARGSLGAAVATLFAAASHSLAGDNVSVIAIAATAILALPVCVALAGRVGSLWRLALAVGISQFVFHWSFAGLGSASSSTGSTDGALAVSPHVAHLGQLLAPLGATSAGAASMTTDFNLTALMWAAHAVAAILTIALLHRGEHASIGLARFFLRAVLPRLRPHRLPTPARRASLPLFYAVARLLERIASPSAITHRGPPLSRRALHA